MTAQQELEQQALASVDTPAKLRKRLTDARSVLSDGLRGMFRPGRLDVENRRLLSSSGRFALQWKLRHKPDQPVGYNNQQTNRGIVVLEPVETPPDEPALIFKGLTNQQIALMETIGWNLEAWDTTTERMRVVYQDGRVSRWFNAEQDITWEHIRPHRESPNAPADVL